MSAHNSLAICSKCNKWQNTNGLNSWNILSGAMNFTH